MAKQELPDVERAHRRDLHEAARPGARSCTCYADARPGPEFEPVEPDLEDVYFSVMAGHHGARAARTARCASTAAAP